MTTKNAGEKEQGMSEGPYKVDPSDGGPYRVFLPDGTHDNYTDEVFAGMVCRKQNEAHAIGLAKGNAEIVRLRHSLNMIAWPGTFGINTEQATVDMFRHIAQDTLAIGAVGATIRLEQLKAAHPMKSGEAYSVRKSVWSDVTVFVIEGPQGPELSCAVEAYAVENCRALNRAHDFASAHAHATAAAARRVRELEEALRVASTMCVKCFGRGTYSTGCPCIDDPRWEPDYHNCGAYDAECDDSTCVKVRAALAGKERSDGAN
jgi:hypothetical protein